MMKTILLISLLLFGTSEPSSLVVGSAGGHFTFDNGTRVDVPEGFLTDEATIFIEVSSVPPTTYPPDLPAYYSPSLVIPIANAVKLEIPYAAIDFSGTLGVDEEFIAVRIPAFESAPDRPALVEVRVKQPDGTEFFTIGSYRPIPEGVTAIPGYSDDTVELGNIGLGNVLTGAMETVEITLQPVTFDLDRGE